MSTHSLLEMACLCHRVCRVQFIGHTAKNLFIGCTHGKDITHGIYIYNTCMFYDQPETIDHLFFQYTITKCVWAMIGQCMGLITHQENASSTSSVSIGGCQELNIHHFGFAAVCWAIWKYRDKAVVNIYERHC